MDGWHVFKLFFGVGGPETVQGAVDEKGWFFVLLGLANDIVRHEKVVAFGHTDVVDDEIGVFAEVWGSCDLSDEVVVRSGEYLYFPFGVFANLFKNFSLCGVVVVFSGFVGNVENFWWGCVSRLLFSIGISFLRWIFARCVENADSRHSQGGSSQW